jgi:hypothetical protein
VMEQLLLTCVAADRCQMMCELVDHPVASGVGE